jgi:hypothetical protein
LGHWAGVEALERYKSTVNQTIIPQLPNP